MDEMTVIILCVVLGGVMFFLGYSQDIKSDTPIKHNKIEITTVNGVTDTLYILER